MKNIIYSILVCLPFVFGACDKSTDDTSKVTYFVTLEREGDEKIVLEKGQPFVEPGYYAEMNGEDITESVQIKGSVDVNTPGIYNLVYAAYEIYKSDVLPQQADCLRESAAGNVPILPEILILLLNCQKNNLSLLSCSYSYPETTFRIIVPFINFGNILAFSLLNDE